MQAASRSKPASTPRRLAPWLLIVAWAAVLGLGPWAAARAQGAGNVNVRTVPSAVRSLLAEGHDLLMRADWPGALKAYERASQADPGNPYALTGRAVALQKLGRMEQARVVFGDAVAAGGHNFEVQANLAMLLVDSDPAGALAMIRTERRRDEHSAAHDAIAGYIHARAGDDAAAADLLRRAVQRGPASPTLLLNYAIVLDRLGRQDEAAATYRRALALGPPADGAEAQASRRQTEERLRWLESQSPQRAGTAAAAAPAASRPRTP